jgi:chromosome segregation ATPase
VNANADQKARLLEVRVVENAGTIEQLRQERSLLVADYKDLQRQFSEVSEVSSWKALWLAMNLFSPQLANRLRDKHASSQSSHDNRRHQLDLHLGEIDELRCALSDQAMDLHRTEEEKNRLAAERSDVVRTVTSLEADLKRVKRDAEAFGRDLKILRAAKEKLETQRRDDEARADRVRKQAQAQIRLLSEQLDGQREQTRQAREELTNHTCVMSVSCLRCGKQSETFQQG